MSDKKITQLTALTGANAVAGDQLAIVDVSDTTMSASGTTKKIALSELQAAPLSAGTANGVAYLNASKVLTTGSGLTFNGAIFSNTNAIKSITEGAGINATNSGLVAQRSTNDSQLYIGYRTTPDAWVVGATYTSTGAYKPIAFAVNDAEQMRLTSTGLGIGTSSPSYAFDALNSNTAGIRTIARFGVTGNGGSGRGVGIMLGSGGSGNSVDVAQIVGFQNSASATANSAALAFQVSNTSGNLTEAMRIDSAGTLLVGTQSVIGGAQGVVQIRGNLSLTAASAVNGGFQQIDFAAGGYVKAAIRGYSVGTTDAGELRFYTAPAGDLVNERARIDSSGNLGLGVTPSAWGSNHKAFNIAAASTSHLVATVNNLAFGTNYYSDNTNFIYVTTGQNATRFDATSGGAFRWFNAPSGTAGNAITFTQAMTLDASGNLGIGTTSPSASAILDAQSTTKGVRMPNMTTTQKNAIASPAAGLMVFDTTLAKLCVYTGAAWQTITSV